MKRNRKIANAAHSYLTRRNYANADKCKSKICTLKELINLTISSQECSDHSVVSYSALGDDLLTAHTQFNKFLDLISLVTSPIQSELIGLVTPLFIFIHLELIFSGHKNEAEKFCENVKCLKMDEGNLSDLVRIASSLKTRQQLISNKLANEFRFFYNA